MRALRLDAHGGPDVLVPVELPVPSPGPGQLLVRVRAAGVNFIDTYQRTGLYKVTLPYVPGLEGAGEVVAGDLPAGTRVAWASAPGSYAEYAIVPADKAVPVPDGVADEVAAAAMLQGMTARYLTHATRPLGEGDACVILAAAGGTGLLLCQMARRRGARVIAVVSSDEKEALAREAGAHEVLRYEGFAAKARALTGGRGVDVVYDGVGRATVAESLAALAVRGTLALFGQSSGPVPPIDPAELAKGSLYLTRPSLFHYTQSREELLEHAGAVLRAIAAGELRVRIAHRLPLERAGDAHRVLEGRGSLGKILLIP
ncbi:MAG: quinone oxidoreductase family protein [Myxococcota bacterium]